MTSHLVGNVYESMRFICNCPFPMGNRNKYPSIRAIYNHHIASRFHMLTPICCKTENYQLCDVGKPLNAMTHQYYSLRYMSTIANDAPFFALSEMLISSVVEKLRTQECSDVIMSTIVSQNTRHTIDYSTVFSGAGKRKHQSPTPLTFVRGIHRWPVNSPHKGPVTRKIFPFDDVIMVY